MVQIIFDRKFYTPIITFNDGVYTGELQEDSTVVVQRSTIDSTIKALVEVLKIKKEYEPTAIKEQSGTQERSEVTD